MLLVRGLFCRCSASERGISARSAEAAGAVTVTVGCFGNPEVTRMKNNTNHRITVRASCSVVGRCGRMRPC